MQLDDALEQLDAIHDHLAKGEVYRGFQAIGVAASGVLGLLAAAAEPWLVDQAAFFPYWIVVALVCGLVSVATAIGAYLREDDWARRKTRTVFGQFAPCLAVGAAVTLVLPRLDAANLLPGLWALIFGLGIFSVRPFLPRAIGWVGLFYLASGIVILSRGGEPRAWDVGGVFGLGQLAMALVLYWNLERNRGETIL